MNPPARMFAKGVGSLGAATLLLVAACGDTPGENPPPSAPAAPPAESGGSDEDWDEEAYVFFESRHVTSRVGDCVVPAPGEDVVFSAEGFAPGSLVEVEQAGGTVDLVDLSLPALGSVRVDAAGRFEFVWTVPPAPPAWLDPLPRAYAVEATGVDASGEVLAARM